MSKGLRASFVNLIGSLAMPIIFLLLGIDIGIAVCAALSLGNGFNINPNISFQIDPLQILGLLVTIILTVYVVRKFQRDDAHETIEKTMLLDDLADLRRHCIETLSKIVSGGGIKFIEVTASVKGFRSESSDVIAIAKEFKYIDQNSENAENLLKINKKIWELLTKTEIGANGTTQDIEISSGLVSYSKQRQEEVAEEICKFKKAIFKLAFEINRV